MLHPILNNINSLQTKPKENDNKQLFSLQEENVGLKKKIQTLERDLQSAHKLHRSTKNQLEGELLDLKKKLRNTEAKYSNLASTPPKTRTISVVSEETKKQLDQMIAQNKEVEEILSKSRSDYNAKVRQKFPLHRNCFSHTLRYCV